MKHNKKFLMHNNSKPFTRHTQYTSETSIVVTNTLHCEVSYQWHIYRITPPGTRHAECSNCTFVNGAAGAAELLEFVMMVTIVVVVVTVWMLMTMLVVKLKSMVMTRRSRALSDPCLGRSSSVGGEYYTKQQQ